MADTQPSIQPTNSEEGKMTPLREVQLDAEFNFKQRLDEAEAKRKHEEQKNSLKNGK